MRRAVDKGKLGVEVNRRFVDQTKNTYKHETIAWTIAGQRFLILDCLDFDFGLLVFSRSVSHGWTKKGLGF